MKFRSLYPVANLAAVAAGISFAIHTSDAAQAAPILSRTDPVISAFALAENQFAGELVDMSPPTIVPLGSTIMDPAFMSPFEPGWSSYTGGTPLMFSSFPFSSAFINGAGFAGVGVSGKLDSLDFRALAAGADWLQTVTNTGGAGSIKLTYTIPFIEISTIGNRYEGDVGGVRASMTALRRNSLGQEVENISLFDYRLGFNYVKPPTTFAIQTFTASPDLLNDSGGLVNIDPNCQLAACNTGKKTLPFSVTKTIPRVDPGDEIVFSYMINTFLQTGREGGGHALYGDPFELSAGPGPEFLTFNVEEIAVDPPPRGVPEPGTLLLTLAGLLGMGRTRLSHAGPMTVSTSVIAQLTENGQIPISRLSHSRRYRY